MKRAQWITAWRMVALVGLLALWLVAPVEAQDATPPGKTVTQTAGPLRIELSADRAAIGLADRLQLTLTVEAPAGTEVTLPEAAKELGAFAVRRQTPSGPTAIDPQTQRWQQAYILDAGATGEQVIPPLALSFREANAAPDAAPTAVQTEPLAITVTSVLPQDADVQAPRDIAPPVELVPPLLPPWPWIAAALLGLAGIAGLLWWWRHRARRPAPPPPPRPAHALALEALQRLQRDNLMEQQAIEAFYVRLSFILRQYIEWRFGLRAPEQTTEEFLAAALASGGLVAAHQQLLSSFLQQCDLVKFARHEPTRGDMQQAFDSAKAFVEQTADDEVLIAVTAGEVA